MKTSARPWRIRAVQLDLARQRETLPAIQQFIRFARKWGYNTLVLYLEGVVRTKSFPYRPANQSYTPDDMRRIVAMADRAGLEVVPCVSTLGHMEHFTQCRQLHHLREDAHRAPHMFCPSSPRVYAFLERYLAEITALFPGRNFHIGCDEVWGLGTCPACRRRGLAREDLLLAHVHRVRAIMQSLGKRVWIWDDMFENTPESKLAELPRDVGLCAWNYGAEQMDYDGVQGHFNNLDRRDWLALYEKLGFDVLICPWGREIENTVAYTEVARQRRVLGGLQTNWELATGFLPSLLPGAALAGALWSQPQRDPEQVLTTTLERLFPSLDATARGAVRASLIGGLWWGTSVANSLRGRLTMEESRQLQNLIVVEKLLAAQLRRRLTGLERDILEQLHTRVRLQVLTGRQRDTLPRLIDPRLQQFDRRAVKRRAAGCVREWQALARQRAQDWRRYRPGILPDHASAYCRRQANELRDFLRETAATPQTQRAMLQARLFLWDGYSMPQLQVELRAAGKWREIYRGCFKPVNLRDAQYTLQVPVRWTGRRPDRIRFTVTGFGGQGISFTALHFTNGSLMPAAVKRQRGQVVNPRAILKDDSTVCYLGSPDTVRALREHREDRESVVELALATA